MSKKNKTEWTKKIPTEPGKYWFYGDPYYGGMGRDFKEDAVVEPNDIKMHLMSVWKIANGLMIVTGGSFIPPEPFDIEKLQAGPLGYWKPAVLPESPEDVCELFS